MNHKRQNFLEGAIVLTTATLVVKVIGALFKIPLANILGGVGMSYFVSAYDIFTPIYSLTVTGLSVAVSRVVSEAAVSGGRDTLGHVLGAARRIFLLLGVLGSLLLALFARGFSSLINNPGSAAAIYAIVPAIFFSCVTAAYRGYCQGLSNMVPTAKSQVLEAVVKLTAGTALSFGVTRYLQQTFLATGEVLGHAAATPAQANLWIFQYSAAAAILGVTLSTAAGALYMHLYFKASGGKVIRPTQRRDRLQQRDIGRRLLSIAIPISLATLVVNLTSIIDLMSVMNCLKGAITRDSAAILSMYSGLIPPEVTLDVLPEYLYGSYSGLAFSLFNLIPSITAALGISAIPSVTASYLSGSRERLNETVGSILRITLMVALPAGLGLSVLSGPILTLLYPARTMEAAIITPVLRVMGISSILVAVTTPINSILQAIGRERLPLLALSMGAVVKLGTNFFLVSQPQINIQGVPYGTLFCYGLIILISSAVLIFGAGIRLPLFSIFVKPLFCAGLCAATAHYAYGFLFASHGNTLRVLVAIAAAALVYVLALLLTGTITKADAEMLPGGKKIVKTLEKMRFIR